MGGLNMMLSLLSIAALVASTSAQTGGGVSGVVDFSIFGFEVQFRCSFSFDVQTQVGPITLQMALKEAFSSMSFGGEMPASVIILVNDEGPPVDLAIQLYFEEPKTPGQQSLIFQAISAGLSRLQSVVSRALNATNINVVSETTLTCGDLTTTLSFNRLPEIVDFVENCNCTMEPRMPSCGPVDASSIIFALIESMDFLLNNALRQDTLNDQQRMRIDALEDLLEIEVNRLESQIQALLGADLNQTTSLLGSIQELRDDVQALQNLNQDLELRLADLDSRSNTCCDLGIAGTVFGALAVLTLFVICCCLCCCGNRALFFAPGRPLLTALPRPPMPRPVINGPMPRCVRPPPGNKMAMFGMRGIGASPIYGNFYR